MTRYRGFVSSAGAVVGRKVKMRPTQNSIRCDMQFAVVANELNMRIAIIPKENEKSEPSSNRKQVRIFLVWWARVDSNHRS